MGRAWPLPSSLTTPDFGILQSCGHVLDQLWKNWLKRCLNNEEFVGIFYQITGVVADASHTVLPQIHLTPYAAYMQIHPNLLGVRNPGHYQARSI